MGTEYTLHLETGWLRVENADDFEIIPEGVLRQHRDIIAACREHGVNRVLVRGKGAVRRLRSFDAFKNAESLSTASVPGLKLAIFLEGHVPDGLTDFFVNASSNRGVPVAFFPDEAAARKWLGIPAGT
ncbi:MAG: hypothetical protein V1809_15830 [Planctomycetota bacterium]